MRDTDSTVKVKNPWRCTLLAMSSDVRDQSSADRVSTLLSQGHYLRARISLAAATSMALQR